jgi:hypothetical protein
LYPRQKIHRTIRNQETQSDTPQEQVIQVNDSLTGCSLAQFSPYVRGLADFLAIRWGGGGQRLG